MTPLYVFMKLQIWNKYGAKIDKMKKSEVVFKRQWTVSQNTTTTNFTGNYDNIWISTDEKLYSTCKQSIKQLAWF